MLRLLFLLGLLVGAPVLAQAQASFLPGVPTGNDPTQRVPLVVPGCVTGPGSDLPAVRAVPCGTHGTAASASPLQSTPTETTTSVGTTSTPFGTAGGYRALTVQAQGSPMCITFGTGTPTQPSSAGVCAVGIFVANGQTLTYGPVTVPNSQGKAAAATGGSVWESTQ